MSQQEKAKYFNLLKDAGVEFTKHYREYTTEELKRNWDHMQAALAVGPEVDDVEFPEDAPEPAPAGFFGFDEEEPEAEAPRPAPAPMQQPAPPPPPQQQPRQRNRWDLSHLWEGVPVRDRDTTELPGQNLSKPEDEPLRVDPSTGRLVYQEEVMKPATPRPRGRRVLTTNDPGTKIEQIQDGRFTESFEVAGDRTGTQTQIKITLPSYQVGMVRDRRFPFKIYTYGSKEGFDLFEVQEYFGGPEMVPDSCKRTYVENVLVYDIRSVIRTIQQEFRQLQLTNRIPAL